MAGATDLPDTVTFGKTTVETVTPPTQGSQDQCIICGTPLYYGGRGRHPQYCDEHRPTSASNSANSRPRTGNRGKGKAGKHVEASEQQWDDFIRIVTLGGSYILARWIAGGSGLMLDAPPHFNKEIFEDTTEHYAMNADEAAPLAAFFSRRAVGSVLNKKAGFMVVAALDLEEIGEALWTYGRRVGPGISARVQQGKAPNVKAPRRQRSNGNPRQDTNNAGAPDATAGGTGISNADAVRLFRPTPSEPPPEAFTRPA